MADSACISELNNLRNKISLDNNKKESDRYMNNDERFISTLLKANKIKHFVIEPYRNIVKNSLFYVLKDEKYNFVKYRLETMQKLFLSTLEIDNFHKTNYESFETFTTYGVIADIGGGKISKDSVYLFSNIDSSNEVFVKLNLSNLKWYSLFSGQIVAVTGKMHIKGEIMVEKINCIPFVNNNDEEPDKKESKTETLEIRIISGPFDQVSDACPIEEFFKDKFDIAIICGPICSKKASNDAMFEIQDKIDKNIKDWLLKSMSSKVIIIPSAAEFNDIGLFPQSAKSHPFVDRVFYLSNPTSFYVNNILFAISTFDTLLHLAAEECVFESKDNLSYKNDPEYEFLFENGKLHRLATHLVYQCSYLPVIPISEPINYYIPEHLCMEIVPDFFITTSKLRQFITNIGLVRFMNTGFQSSSNNKLYAKIIINDFQKFRTDSDFLSKNIHTEIVKLFM